MMDLVGHRYGLLTVLEYAGKRGQKHHWRCRCDCGNETTPAGGNLRSGNTTSCGCERVRFASTHGVTHRMSGTRTYKTWTEMHARCSRPSNYGYRDYGGRGIRVCERWSSFENFFEDMGERPLGYSIERINNDEGYSPENCKWATPQEQANNRRSNRVVELNGEKMTVAQLSRISGLGQTIIIKRLNRGWPVEKAVQ